MCKILGYFNKDNRIGTDLLIFNIDYDEPGKIVQFLQNNIETAKLGISNKFTNGKNIWKVEHS